MKKVLIAVIFINMFVFFNVYSEQLYPEDFYIKEKSTGFKILLGSSPVLFHEHFSEPFNKEILLKAIGPEYEIWREEFSEGIMIIYDTYDYTINYIEVFSEKFSTSKGITIGDTADDVVNEYGEADSFYGQEDGSIRIVYETFNPEINHESQYTEISFRIKDSIVIEILFEISDTV